MLLMIPHCGKWTNFITEYQFYIVCDRWQQMQVAIAQEPRRLSVPTATNRVTSVFHISKDNGLVGNEFSCWLV